MHGMTHCFAAQNALQKIEGEGPPRDVAGRSRASSDHGRIGPALYLPLQA